MTKGNMERTSEQRIRIQKNGPYQVSGNVPLAKQAIVSDGEGASTGWESGERYPDQKEYALCRCGQSGHKPFCDETHHVVDFDGTETAGKKKYLDSAEANPRASRRPFLPRDRLPHERGPARPPGGAAR